MDRAVISTIHSFCMGLIAERPVEAGVDPAFGVADEVEAETLFEIAWERWLQEKMVPGNRKLKTAFAHGATLKNTSTLARTFLNVRDMLDWLPAPVPLGDATGLVEEIRTGVASVRVLMKNGLRNPGDGITAQISEIEGTLDSIDGIESPQNTGDLVDRLVSLEIKKRVGALSNWSSKDAGRVAKEILAGLRDGLVEFKEVFLHNAAVGLAEELRSFVKVYEKVKRERGVLDFDDLLITARDLLRDSGEARRYFKSKYKFILIDEFQDTDPLQAEVAFFLAEKLDSHGTNWEDLKLEKGKLFLVGDPKQSIYRFRRADIEVYERSKRALQRQGSLLNINVNFRSTPGVLDPVNLVFKDLMRRPDRGDYQPDYITLEAYRKAEATGLVALTAGGRLPEDPSAEEKRGFEATAIAWLVKDVVEKGRWQVFDKSLGSYRPVRYADTALLFRATTGLDIYEEALRAWEIPYRVAGGKAFYVREEIQALVAVLTAIENPHDGVAVVGALRSPFFGLSDDKIFLQWTRVKSLNYEETEAEGEVNRAFVTLRELRNQRNSLPLAVLLDRLFEATGALPAFCMRPQGEQRVANLLKISGMAARLEEAGPVTFKQFVRWTAEQSDRGVQEGESPVREAGDDFVSVLTIHKAKGLEFPVVIAPGLWAQWRTVAERVVADRGSGDLEINLSASSGIATAGWAGAWDHEKKILEAERIRLLYVAMTRAKDKLVMPCLFGIDRSDGKMKPSAAKGHLNHLRPLMDEALAGDSPWAEVIEVPGSCLEPRREKAFRSAQVGASADAIDYTLLDSSWKSSIRDCLSQAARAESIAHPTGLVPALEPAGGVPSGLRANFPGGRSFDVGRKVGVLVHRLLEALDPDDLSDLDSLALSFAADLGLGRAAFQNAVKMTRNFYESPVAQRIRAARCVRREVPFCVCLGAPHGRAGEPDPAGEMTVEGAADLVMEEDDGWRVVDFKTDKVDESEVADRAAHYRLQGACYALCLSSIIGRPVKEVVFYFLYPQVAHTFAADEAFVHEARLALGEKLRHGSSTR
jgi:ATP-dependent helicase/nuclease subunit A